MKINIRESAVKDLKKIGGTDKKRIHNKILELENFPDVSNLKKLTDFEPAYRARVGNYRILFDIVKDTVEIGRILHRKESYKKA
ncbi:MAG: plasmid stabilization protein [Desulfobacteraceae bacterium IS3]|nr:MAG: plasmid stabilization protein [Desulfobacteraceae bacterium IS3]